ncbi:hypothetical protein AVEN_17033-1 [Araneus ventricosus]|uniref:Uncharacterized protein n=1 Tax=Araneus ventricosus TaxID=182803 RepID=A0A4Y2QHG1_ARAVE|nr:hypothetical protein AVEN_17033-1 [Araneus ventricosus]
MCIVVSFIGCGTITKGIKTPVEYVGLDTAESPQRQTIAICCAMCQIPEDTNSATARDTALCCCRKAHIPLNCVTQTARRRSVRTRTCCLCAFVPSARQNAVALGPWTS